MDIKKILTTPWMKACVKLAVFIGIFCVFREAFSAAADFKLDNLDGAIKGHIQGDVGRLLLYASMGWAVIGCVAKFNVFAIISPLIIMLFIQYGPAIVDGVTGAGGGL